MTPLQGTQLSPEFFVTGDLSKQSVLLRTTLAASLALLGGAYATTSIGANTQQAADLGSTKAAQTTTVTLVLKLHDQAALEDYIRPTVTQGDPLYQQFLTTEQFAQRFGATSDEIGRVQSFLKLYGITATETLPNHLAIKATATINQLNAAFQTSVHDYQSADGRHFHRPSTQPVIPSIIADWYYYGIPGYEPAAGIGTLNVANFNLFLHAGL